MATQKCRMGGRDVARHRRSAAREGRCAPHLVHGDLADLLAVGLARAGLHARRLLQQNCGTGRGARHEGRCRMSDFEGCMPWAGRDWPQQRAGPGELCAVSLAYGGRAAGAWSARISGGFCHSSCSRPGRSLRWAAARTAVRLFGCQLLSGFPAALPCSALRGAFQPAPYAALQACMRAALASPAALGCQCGADAPDAGGVLSTKVKLRSSYTVISTGMIMPALSCAIERQGQAGGCTLAPVGWRAAGACEHCRWRGCGYARLVPARQGCDSGAATQLGHVPRRLARAHSLAHLGGRVVLLAELHDVHTLQAQTARE